MPEAGASIVHRQRQSLNTIIDVPHFFEKCQPDNRYGLMEQTFDLFVIVSVWKRTTVFLTGNSLKLWDLLILSFFSFKLLQRVGLLNLAIIKIFQDRTFYGIIQRGRNTTSCATRDPNLENQYFFVFKTF